MPGSKEFGSLLEKAIEAAELTQSEFARRVGKKPGVIQFIRQGVRTPPPEALARWAEVLGLQGEDRDRFLYLGAIAHLPAPLQPVMTKLVDSHLRLLRDARRLRER